MYHVYMLHEACIRTQMPAEFQLLAIAPPHNFISLRMLGGRDRFMPVQHTEYVFVYMHCMRAHYRCQALTHIFTVLLVLSRSRCACPATTVQLQQQLACQGLCM
jgi:hypothetical protein